MNSGRWREHPEARAELLAESDRLPVDAAEHLVTNAEIAVEDVRDAPDSWPKVSDWETVGPVLGGAARRLAGIADTPGRAYRSGVICRRPALRSVSGSVALLRHVEQLPAALVAEIARVDWVAW